MRQGSELLTTITNDAWYGESSAPFQHFELATMRAIEQGRYLVRAANTGISGIVDPYGRVLGAHDRSVRDDDLVIGEVRFLQERTVYATIGDLARAARRAADDARLGVPAGTDHVSSETDGTSSSMKAPMSLVLEDLIRRSEGLVKRARDLRSYL